MHLEFLRLLEVDQQRAHEKLRHLVAGDEDGVLIVVTDDEVLAVAVVPAVAGSAVPSDGTGIAHTDDLDNEASVLNVDVLLLRLGTFQDEVVGRTDKLVGLGDDIPHALIRHGQEGHGPEDAGHVQHILDLQVAAVAEAQDLGGEEVLLRQNGASARRLA